MPQRPVRIICRCEDVEEREVVKWIRKGYKTPEELKRILRVGMGHCQGRTCLNLLLRVIARETKAEIRDIPLPRFRPPLKPVPIRILASFGEEES